MTRRTRSTKRVRLGLNMRGVDNKALGELKVPGEALMMIDSTSVVVCPPGWVGSC